MAASCVNGAKKRPAPLKNENIDGKEAKKVKITAEGDANNSHPSWTSLESFTVVKVLSCDPQSKLLCLHAKANKRRPEETTTTTAITTTGVDETLQQSSDNDTGDAIIVLEKTPFDTDNVALLVSKNTAVKKVFDNDIYGTYEGYPNPQINALRTTIIFPATEKHLDKYKLHDSLLIQETPENYRNVTLPWIESESFNMQWIYNILAKKKESEFIIYEDADPVTGFIMLPDLKWDRKQMDNMYVSGIVHTRNIKSIRDLRAEHLPLLKKLLADGTAAIEKAYGIPSNKVRAYFHYQPSYYHLHVHFNQIKYNAPGSNTLKAHLLADVIDNIQMYPEYYAEKTLTFVCQEQTKLFNQYKEAGLID